ncbi:ATP-dependent metallopeptidase FtsH/Yme1/Tma family protein, partial [Myxococcota bacterium]|nr:ATP-dependent metallopeptidase FtsH/Yme1/Tma family protein [Myxococcota bacterium]
MKQSHKTILVWIVLIGLFVMLFKMWNKNDENINEIKFSKFIADVENGEKLADVKIVGNTITGKYVNGNAKFKTTGLVSPQLLEKLGEEEVEYELEKKSESWWPSLLMSWLPMLLLFVLFFF